MSIDRIRAAFAAATSRSSKDLISKKELRQIVSEARRDDDTFEPAEKATIARLAKQAIESGKMARSAQVEYDRLQGIYHFAEAAEGLTPRLKPADCSKSTVRKMLAEVEARLVFGPLTDIEAQELVSMVNDTGASEQDRSDRLAALARALYLYANGVDSKAWGVFERELYLPREPQPLYSPQFDKMTVSLESVGGQLRPKFNIPGELGELMLLNTRTGMGSYSPELFEIAPGDTIAITGKTTSQSYAHSYLGAIKIPTHETTNPMTFSALAAGWSETRSPVRFDQVTVTRTMENGQPVYEAKFNGDRGYSDYHTLFINSYRHDYIESQRTSLTGKWKLVPGENTELEYTAHIRTGLRGICFNINVPPLTGPSEFKLSDAVVRTSVKATSTPMDY